MRKAMIWIVAALVVLAVTFIAGDHYGKYLAPKTEEKANADTVYRTDTFFRPVPVPVEVKVVDSVFVPVRDTVRRCDTLLMAIPREQKTYSTAEYMAVISGVMPNLDYMETYQLTRTVTRTVTQKRSPWGVSVGAGPAIIYSPFTRGIDAGVGVWGGVSYTF